MTATLTRRPRARATTKPTVAIEIVTPTQAAEWLRANFENRRLRESRLTHVMGILQRGEWKLTGDALVFNVDGHLLNGQHRLTAVVNTKTAAPFVVLRNVPTETRDVMDQGLQRNLADALKFRGYVNVFRLAATVNWVIRLRYIKETGNIHYGDPGLRPTVPQALTVIEKNPGIVEAMHQTELVIRKLKVKSGVAGALRYEMNRLNPDDAEAFWTSLYEGTGLRKRDPIWHLRNILISDAQATARMRDWRVAALISKAWNLWRDGQEIGQLAWKYGGQQKEEFPILR